MKIKLIIANLEIKALDLKIDEFNFESECTEAEYINILETITKTMDATLAQFKANDTTH